MLIGKRRQIIENNKDSSDYLVCEKDWVYNALMLSAGTMGAYTYVLRGGVFCNAQTANFVIMAIAFGQGHYKEALYYLIPVTAYFMGALLSELLPNPIKRMGLLRWDTYLIGFEALILFITGLMPLTVPNHIIQVSINFIASMQYNTFRQAEGVPMATTFCTNHLRQIGIGVAQYIRKKDNRMLKKSLKHLRMILFFLAGGIIETILCNLVEEKAIWFAFIIMFFIFCKLAYADIVYEHDKLREKPHGH